MEGESSQSREFVQFAPSMWQCRAELFATSHLKNGIANDGMPNPPQSRFLRTLPMYAHVSYIKHISNIIIKLYHNHNLKV